MIGHARIRGGAIAVHFPQHDPKAPHITGKTILAIVKGLGGRGEGG